MREVTPPSCSRGSRVSPRENFGKMDANGAFWAHFWLNARWVLLHIEPERGGFHPLAVRVGGVRVSQENFWKTDANGALWALFTDCLLIFSPILLRHRGYTWCGSIFTYRENFLLLQKKGVSPPVFFFFFFLKNGCKLCILGPFLADWCWYFLEFSKKFCHESPDVEGMWCGSFPLIYRGLHERSFFFYLV